MRAPVHETCKQRQGTLYVTPCIMVSPGGYRGRDGEISGYQKPATSVDNNKTVIRSREHLFGPEAYIILRRKPHEIPRSTSMNKTYQKKIHGWVKKTHTHNMHTTLCSIPSGGSSTYLTGKAHRPHPIINNRVSYRLCMCHSQRRHEYTTISTPTASSQLAKCRDHNVCEPSA